jgi:hypothetical protein
MFIDTRGVNMKREVGSSLGQREYSIVRKKGGPGRLLYNHRMLQVKKSSVHRLDVHWPVRDGYRDSAFNHVPLA